MLAGTNPVATLRALADARNPIYAEAHLRVASDGARHGASVEAIVRALAAASPPR